MTKTVSITYEVTVTIPDDKIPEILKDFRKSINDQADEEDLFIQVAGYVIEGGGDFVEGIGDLNEEEITTRLEPLPDIEVY